MAAKVCALLVGLFYLFFGISGLFPSLVHLPPPRLRFYEYHMIGHWGILYGWLPSNPVHAIVYILLGAGGVMSCVLFVTAVWYCRGMFAVMFLFAVLGFLPAGISHLWGLMPLLSWNVMVHAITAMLVYYYGFVYPLDLGGREPESEMM